MKQRQAGNAAQASLPPHAETIEVADYPTIEEKHPGATLLSVASGFTGTLFIIGIGNGQKNSPFPPPQHPAYGSAPGGSSSLGHESRDTPMRSK